MGIGDGGIVNQQDADILTGNPAFDLSVLPDKQLSQMDR